MVLQLNGHPRSAASHRVCVVMLAMGLQRDKDFELGTFDFKSIKEPAWREKQPFGQMPYMDDTENDITTYESRAMVRYLAAKHNSPLLITQKDGLKAYADFETACSAEAANFDEHARTIVKELMIAPIFGNQPNQALVEDHRKILEENLKAFDQILKDRKYMAGDQLTIVDFFYLPIGSYLVETGAVPSMTDGSLPNFTRWWESMVNTQEWQFIQRFIALALSQGLGDM